MLKQKDKCMYLARVCSSLLVLLICTHKRKCSCDYSCIDVPERAITKEVVFIYGGGGGKSQDISI